MAEDLPELLRRVHGHEPEAVTSLIARFHDSAQRLARALVPADEVEDVVQEAFATAILQLNELRAPAAFPAWLRQIVRSRANRRLRKRVHESSRDAGGGRPDALIDRCADERSPPRQAELTELQELVRGAVARIPEGTRAAVELFYFDGRTVNDVAAILDVPVGTVKRRLHDGRERLRQLLGGLDEETRHDEST